MDSKASERSALQEIIDKNPTLQCVGDQRSSRSSDLGFMS